MQRVSQSRERKALLPRCWGMRCVAYVETKHLAFIIMCWAVRAVKVSSDAASSKEHNTLAKMQAAVRWTCTCGASVSSAVCASAGRPACWSNVSDSLTINTRLFLKEGSYAQPSCFYLIRNTMNSNIIKYSKINSFNKNKYCFLVKTFSNVVCSCDGRAEFSAAVLSVTWSLRNHSDMLIWYSENISNYCQCWKQLCC